MIRVLPYEERSGRIKKWVTGGQKEQHILRPFSLSLSLTHIHTHTHRHKSKKENIEECDFIKTSGYQ